MLNFLYTPVSWVLLLWHRFFTSLGIAPNAGLNWALSIVFLTITMRLLLFRLFIKQIKYQRQMMVLQPKIKAIQQKYKNDRAEQQRQMMALQQEHGFNPLAGCLPLLLQWPIFIALFHVLRHLSNSVAQCGVWQANPAQVPSQLTLYTFSARQTCDAATARLFGGAPLAARLFEAPAALLNLQGTRGVLAATILVLVAISAFATFMTQRLARKANPVQAEGQAAMIQNAMQYLIPVGTLGSGLFFPLGVLVYWFTSNTWTMAQQVYVNKFHPHESVNKAPVGELGKTLAPKPGARPVRHDKATETAVAVQPATAAETGAAEGDQPTDRQDDQAQANPAGPQSNTPRPGQRPNRPGNRPGGNRSPNKKRR